MSLLAFTGRAGAGKRTAARFLCEYKNYQCVEFAQPLHDISKNIINVHFLRSQIKEEFLIKQIDEKIKLNNRVVIPDLVSINEAKYITSVGGFIIRIIRDDIEENNFFNAHITVKNNGTIDDFEKTIFDMYYTIFGYASLKKFLTKSF